MRGGPPDPYQILKDTDDVWYSPLWALPACAPSKLGPADVIRQLEEGQTRIRQRKLDACQTSPQLSRDCQHNDKS
jgi:hypothetical protein